MIKKLILIVLIAIIVVSVTSYASTVSVSSKTDQAYYGVSFSNSNAFNAEDQGFSVQGANAAASAQPCTWTSGGTCRQALTASHYVYKVIMILKIVPASTTTYTYTTKWDQGAGQVTIGALTVNVPNTAVVGQTMTFTFDTGSTTFSTPQSMDIAIA